MKRFASIVGVSTCILLASILVSMLPGRHVAASNVQSVNVTNPSLAVTQSGSWNVGISGTPTVNLSSAASIGINGTAKVEIVHDDENADAAFQATMCLDAGGGTCGAVPPQVHVPLGNVLVIDYISGECETSFQAGSAVTDMVVGTNVGGHFLNHHFGNFNIGAGTHFATGTMTRLYSGPDSNVILGANFVNGDPNDHCDATISGHLIPQ
jgi:hypothetical protein